MSKIKEFHALAEYEKSSSRLQSLCDEIIIQLKAHSLRFNTTIFDKEISSKIHSAKQFIENNCQCEISLKEMSSVACSTEFYFNKFFRKCYELSPYAYHFVCKLKKSQKILIKQKSVIETTYDTGFFD